MSATAPRLSRDEFASHGDDVYSRQIRPNIRPEDEGKYVALDVESGSYEIGEDEPAAVAWLRNRAPGAQVWLVRVGTPATHHLRSLLTPVSINTATAVP